MQKQIHEKKTSVFDQFTNKYAISKTLRFELKPIGNTKQMLENEDVFKKDEIIQKKYEETKPYFDRLHREFIEEAFKNCRLNNANKYFDVLQKLKKNKKDKADQKDFFNISAILRKEVVSILNLEAKDWVENKYPEIGFKKNDVHFLFEEDVFKLLKIRYGEEDASFLRDQETKEFFKDDTGNKISIFDSWKGFTGYFTKFQKTRENFYKDDGTSTALATRIIDQNLRRFCENIVLFESIKHKIDFTEVEKNFSCKLETVFSLGYYDSCFLQNGIDLYNEILGGRVEEDNGEKVKGLNEFINKYRQDNKGEKLSFFKMLDKQILSEKEKFIVGIEDDEQLWTTLKSFYESAEEKTSLLTKLFTDFVQNNNNYNLSQVYISKEGLNTILNRWVNESARQEFEEKLSKEEKLIKFDKLSNSYKFPDFIATIYIKNALALEFSGRLWKDSYFKDESDKKGRGFLEEGIDVDKWEQFLKIFHFEFFSLFDVSVLDEKGVMNNVGYNYFKQSLAKIINKDKDNFFVTPEEKLVIREFADNLLSIYQMAKYFALEKKRVWLDEYGTGDFYENPDFGYKSRYYDDAYEKIVKTRMLLQGYLTKKNYNTTKWKLNFESGNLLSGWSSEFDTYSTLLFEKDENYYLGIVKGSSLNKDRRKKLTEGITNDNSCRKMVYDFQKPDNKNVPRLFIRSKGDSFSPAVEEYNLPVDSILDIYDNSLFQTENRASSSFEQSLLKLIDYFKLGFSKHASYKHFHFKWKDSSEYKNIAEFYEDTIRSCYQIRWEILNFEEVENLTKTSEVYLFQLYSKDFSKNSGGSKNLHTLYFQSLFVDENLNSSDGVIFKLSGKGEIFFRPKTSTDELGTRFNNKGIAVTKSKRYAEDKIFLHFPIELNYSRSTKVNFNKEFNNFLLNNSDINIIGIDRGEKHLIYYAGIDQRGNILKDKQGKEVLGSLNTINGVNYYKLLEDRAKNREHARQDWQDIENIKDLKKGYISLVVRKLADLIIEHDAILIFEDLNMRFKQIRGGIERSVYQQLEKALIDKLNFLVNKAEMDPDKAGHLLRAYQLTAPFTTFQEMGKQTGVIFYTQASYTSKTCPNCGYRPNLSLKYENLEKAKIALQKLNISYDSDFFVISYKLSDVANNQVKSQRGNILYSDIERKSSFIVSTKDAIRYRWTGRGVKESALKDGENKLGEQTGKGFTIEYDITACLARLFEENSINYKVNLKEGLKTDLSVEFYKDLFFYLHLLTNTRSSISGTEIDYINCPCCGFHSDKGFRGHVFNGDANGAYNIARKGNMILEKINQYKKENHSLDKLSWGDLFIDIEEWDKFTQK